jgi:hypothetical protein
MRSKQKCGAYAYGRQLGACIRRWTPSVAASPASNSYLKRTISSRPVTSTLATPTAVMTANEPSSDQVVSSELRLCTVMVSPDVPLRCVTSTTNVAASPPRPNSELN